VEAVEAVVVSAVVAAVSAAVAVVVASDREGREAKEAIGAAIRMGPEVKVLSSAIAPIADVKEFMAWCS
jgi:hypothetical protein